MNNRAENTVLWIAVVILAGVIVQQRGCLDTIIQPPSTPEMAILVYESESGALPPYVLGGMRQIGEAGIEVRVIDDDVVTGLDEMPRQVAEAITAARVHGLPALVVIRGGKAEAMAVPKTAEAIVEAVK